jgi:hypothetical protein
MLRAQGWVCGLLLTSVALAGCGSGAPAGARPTKPVKVTVTYNGKPVEGATITFVFQGTEPISANGKTDAQGVAKMKTYIEGDGAVLGKHKVLVMKVETTGETPSVDQNSPDYKPPTGNEPPPQIKHLVPAKYGEFAKTDLTAEVTGGTNDIKLDLKD